jgi:hypothetical protein
MKAANNLSGDGTCNLSGLLYSVMCALVLMN